MPALEVKGLKEAIQNLNDLKGKVKLEVGRAALLDALLLVTERVKAATYTTFTRRTGAIQAGFGVRVAKQLKGDVLNSVVVEYPQSLLGDTKIKSAYIAHHRHSKSRSRKAVSLTQVAFWWFYLEFGTHEHKNARAPKNMTRRIGATRNNRAITKFERARSVGSVAARPWVRPTFASSSQAAVDKFIETMRRKIEENVNAMPK